MQSHNPSGEQEPRRTAPENVGYILALSCFMLPSELSIMQRSSISISITNYIWYLLIQPYVSFKVYSIETMALGIVLFTLSMRLLFAYQVMRLYQGKTSGSRTYLASLLAISLEATQFMTNVLATLWNPENHYIFSSIPLPFLILIALLIMLVFPPEADKSWIEKESKSQWWGPKIVIDSSQTTNSEEVSVEKDS